jgi:hypothetical protein
MRTKVSTLGQVIRNVASILAILLFYVSPVSASCERAGGVSVGLATTSEDGFDHPGWALSGTFECFSGRLLEPRGLFGLSSLEADSSLADAKAKYAFATGGIAFGQLFYGTLGVGAYYRDLDAPITAEGSRGLEFGYNGGVRFLLPMGHNAGIPFDLLYHHVNGPGPDSFWTFTVGLFGW